MLYVIFALLSLAIGSNAAEVITTTGRTVHYTGIPGNSITMHCRGLTPEDNPWLWKKMVGISLETFAAHDDTIPDQQYIRPEYTGRVELHHDNGSVTLSDLRLDDRGTFHCIRGTDALETSVLEMKLAPVDNYNGLLGGSKTLLCKGISESDTFWHWWRGTLPVANLASVAMYHQHRGEGVTSAFRGRIHQHITDSPPLKGAITISNLIYADDQYSFHCTRGNRELLSTAVLAVRIIETDSYVETVGQSITLQCRGTPTPLHSVLWLTGSDLTIQVVGFYGNRKHVLGRDPNRFDMSTTTGDLTISHLTLQDGNKYRCKHSRGNITAQLVVEPAIDIKTYSGLLRESITMPCEGAPDNSEYYRWTKNPDSYTSIPLASLNSHVKDINSRYQDDVELYPTGELKISRLSFYDESLYVCEHPHGTAEAHLKVQKRVMNCTVHAGHDFKLPCAYGPNTATGPIMGVQWKACTEQGEVLIAEYSKWNGKVTDWVNDDYKGRAVLSKNDSSLMLINVSADDPILYTCLWYGDFSYMSIRVVSENTPIPPGGACEAKRYVPIDEGIHPSCAPVLEAPRYHDALEV